MDGRNGGRHVSAGGIFGKETKALSFVSSVAGRLEDAASTRNYVDRKREHEQMRFAPPQHLTGAASVEPGSTHCGLINATNFQFDFNNEIWGEGFWEGLFAKSPPRQLFLKILGLQPAKIVAPAVSSLFDQPSELFKKISGIVRPR